MARSIWNGTIAFGLVNVPIKVFSATEDRTIHFHEVHAADGSRIEHRRICPKDGKQVDYDHIVEVPAEEIAHGYETDDGEQVVLSDAELATAAPRKTRTIDIEAFVDVADVDPIHFDHPYVLMPAGDTEGTVRAYRLLLEVMRRTERAALGRFVLRTREYLVRIAGATS